MWECEICHEQIPIRQRDAHRRKHQEVIHFTQENGEILEILRQEITENEHTFNHFLCPFCHGPHYERVPSLFNHLKVCADRPRANAPAVAAAAEQEYVSFFFFFLFLFLFPLTTTFAPQDPRR